jgi:hypothetical protein
MVVKGVWWGLEILRLIELDWIPHSRKDTYDHSRSIPRAIFRLSQTTGTEWTKSRPHNL